MSDTVRFKISICCSTLPNNSVVMSRSPAPAGAGAAASADGTYCDIDAAIGGWCIWCGAYAAAAGGCLGGTDIGGSLPNDAVSMRGGGAGGGMVVALNVGMLCLCSVTLGSFKPCPPAAAAAAEKSYEAPTCELASLYDCRASSPLLSVSLYQNKRRYTDSKKRDYKRHTPFFQERCLGLQGGEEA